MLSDTPARLCEHTRPSSDADCSAIIDTPAAQAAFGGPLTDGAGALNTDDELLLQGLFVRIWRHLKVQSADNEPLTKATTPDNLRQQLDLAVSRHGVDSDALLNLIDVYLEEAVRTGNTRYMQSLWGHTLIPGLAGDMLASLTNTSMHTYEVSPMATLIEQEMVQTMARIAGYDAGEGVFTSGGSNGNLYGLLCARDWKLPGVQHDGLSGRTLVAFISDESHYSVKMAANVLGIGLDHMIGIPCDAEGKMDVTALSQEIDNQKQAGRMPFCVVATAGTTVRGAFDPLSEIAEVCAREHLWLHVDACLGGAALLSPKHRSLLTGIELADSLCWDPHKLMGMSITCSVFLTRNVNTLARVCSHGDGANYLFHEDNAEYDRGRISLQCGRRVDALKLWLAWKSLGHSGWQKRVDRCMELAGELEAKVRSNARLVLMSERQFTNVCLCYVPADSDGIDLNALNSNIRDRISMEGRFMVTKAVLDGRVIIRPVIINPEVNEAILDELLAEIIRHGDALSES